VGVMLVITALQVKELLLLPIIFVLKAIIVLLNLPNPPGVSQELIKMNLEQIGVKHVQKDFIVILHYLPLLCLIIHLVPLVITALREHDSQLNFPALWVLSITRQNL